MSAAAEQNPLDERGTGPSDPPPIRATFHFNRTQGIQIPESLMPKDADGKPLPAAPDPSVDRRIEVFRAQGVGEDVLQQIRDGKSVSEQEYTLAQHRLNLLKADPEFVRKYLNGDVAAKTTMATLSIILGSRITKEVES